MAELAVTAALATLQIVVPLVLDNLKIADLERVHIKRLETWLCLVKALIQDKERNEGSKTTEEFMKQVRELAYDIEDAVDEIMLHSPPYFFHKHNITRKIHHIAHQVKHRFPLNHGTSNKIESIIKRLDDIGRLETFLERSPSPRSSSSSYTIAHPVSPLLLDHEMVGYEVERKDFIRLLEDGGEGLARLAVVGPNGSGKTTFVKDVFTDGKIRAQFECHAWVHVGRHLDVGDLFHNLLKQLGLLKDQYRVDDQDESLRMLRTYLAAKRYLIVFDDIWTGTDWDCVWKAFPDACTSSRSRIIVTTRSLNTASKVAAPKKHHEFKLERLAWEQGWKLFCRKAFPNSNGECPSEMKECSMKIVERCEGLPLVIVAVASSLALKPCLPNVWKRFDVNLGCETWDQSSNLMRILNTLLPGYIDLPSNLKSCFLYFSIFPEGKPIQRGRLIRLWVAEGFASSTHYTTAEQVAEGHLNELIRRNLVHVSDWDFDGRPRNCRVLSLFLKFIIQKCEVENFASVFNKENKSKSKRIRRLSIHNDCDSTDLAPNADLSGVRSIFLTSLLGTSTADFNQNLRRMKLLRVFDFQAATFIQLVFGFQAATATEFPKGLTDLITIKYISFRGSKIKMIPGSIQKLSYLETLDLMETAVTELPQEISHIHNLRHLFASKIAIDDCVVFDSVEGVKMHDGISNLTDLQELSFLKVDENSKILKALRELKQLQELGLTGLKEDHGNDLCAAVEEMQTLRTLDICTISKEEYLELGKMKIPPRTLQCLQLKGRMREFPAWISSLNNLLRIDLKGSKLQHCPLEFLKKLPNLVELHMLDCYLGEELIFDAPCFMKLKILVIEEMVKLGSVVIEDGAIPDLKQLWIRKCPQLKKRNQLRCNKHDQIELNIDFTTHG